MRSRQEDILLVSNFAEVAFRMESVERTSDSKGNW